MGRKTFDGKNYSSVVSKLEFSWALGASDAEAAFLAEISPAALSRLLADDPKISERKEALKNKPVLEARKCLVEAIRTDPELALKYLERVRKNEFSTKSEVSHRDMTIEELLEAANQQEARDRKKEK